MAAVINWGDPRLPERFWSQVQPDPMGGCWLWAGYSDSRGYGRVSIFGVASQRAHRVTFTHLVGPVGDGLEVDHRCRVHACCNPAHLDAVTHRENVLRGIGGAARNAAKLSCKRGHVFDEANTMTFRRPSGLTFRKCRACMKRRVQLSRAQR